MHILTAPNDGSTKDLSTLLHSIFQQKQWGDRLGIHQVFLFWDETFGELANRAQPDVIRGDTLWVNVSDSVWMQQLQFEKQALLEQINTKLNQLNKCSDKSSGAVPQIKEIKFKLDLNLNVTPHPAHDLAAKRRKSPIDKAQLKNFESSINSISDEKIKKSLVNLWIAQQSRGKPHRIS